MDIEEHARLLGLIIANLQSLEFLLRATLYAQEDPPHSPLPAGQSLGTLAVGDTLPLNAMTDFSTLGQLIDRYNQRVSATHPQLALDGSLIALRDALAHGRVSAGDPREDMTLVKFDRAGRVVFSQKLTEQWLRSQASRVWAEIKKLAKAPGSPVAE